ncbi:MAG: ribonuclease P protein component [Candidatus Zambryskibacteria bacterium]
MFPLLSSGAKTFKNNLFLLKFVPQNDQSRFCFSVSKKVAKSAVVRNRLRRAGYRLLEKYIPKIKPNVLATFSFRVVPKNNDDIIKNLESILNDSLL